MPQTSRRLRERRNGLYGCCFWHVVWKFKKKNFFFCTHVRARTSLSIIPAICVCVCACVRACLCLCLWPLFLDNHWSDLIETCQIYCWGPEYVPFQGLISIGQVVPKLWPFIYQTNDSTRCCVGVADGEWAPFSYLWQDTLLCRRGRWGRDPQPRSPLRVTTYGLPDSDDLLYSNNFSISYAHL